MTRHVRPFNTELLSDPDIIEGDLSELDDPIEAEIFDAEFNDTLDHLVKHAMKTTATAQELDGGQVWQRLSRRVQGPFGFAALEAPALNSLEAELLSSGGRIQQAPFVLNDKVTERAKRPAMESSPAMDCLWDMLRFGASGRALGGSTGVLG